MQIKQVGAFIATIDRMIFDQAEDMPKGVSLVSYKLIHKLSPLDRHEHFTNWLNRANKKGAVVYIYQNPNSGKLIFNDNMKVNYLIVGAFIGSFEMLRDLNGLKKKTDILTRTQRETWKESFKKSRKLLDQITGKMFELTVHKNDICLYRANNQTYTKAIMLRELKLKALGA
jgi:hypothetical protein